MGKLEEQPAAMRHSEHYTPWHGHITVLTVAPAWRRLGHARRLTESLEHSSDINDSWFVDLYVRATNRVAVDMYKGMGYVFPKVSSRGSLTNEFVCLDTLSSGAL
jgi:N-terminal acetyltransferase B complex catalytic subunit